MAVVLRLFSVPVANSKGIRDDATQVVGAQEMAEGADRSGRTIAVGAQIPQG
jgi:hypothetical protein